MTVDHATSIILNQGNKDKFDNDLLALYYEALKTEEYKDYDDGAIIDLETSDQVEGVNLLIKEEIDPQLKYGLVTNSNKNQITKEQGELMIETLHQKNGEIRNNFVFTPAYL